MFSTFVGRQSALRAGFSDVVCQDSAEHWPHIDGG